MKPVYALILSVFILLFSCTKDDKGPKEVTIQIAFSHNWDGMAMTQADLNQFKFTNANNETLSIERLRYLFSNLTLAKADGTQVHLKDYQLVDLQKPESLELTTTAVLEEGSRFSLAFTFGFNNEDNKDSAYPDLNSVSWNVPGMLGGGYHYMQMDGKFTTINGGNPTNFNFHAIRAVNPSDPDNLVFRDTFFEVPLGSFTVYKKSNIQIHMNVAEWFKNPNLWKLTELNSMLMPNFNAQVLMSENGKSVFSARQTVIANPL